MYLTGQHHQRRSPRAPLRLPTGHPHHGLALALGGGEWAFVGDYTTAGCYTYVTGNYVGMAFWSTRSAGQVYKSSHGQRAWVPALGDLVQRADDSSYSVGSCERRVLVRCP